MRARLQAPLTGKGSGELFKIEIFPANAIYVARHPLLSRVLPP
jgi:hypothetical protein